MAYHDVPSLSVRHLVVFLKRKKTDRIQNLVGSFVGCYFCNHLKPRAFPGFASFDKQVRTRKAQNLFLVALYRSPSLSFPSLICSPAHVFRKMVDRWGDRITGLPWMAIFFDIFVLVETRFIFNVTHESRSMIYMLLPLIRRPLAQPRSFLLARRLGVCEFLPMMPYSCTR